MIMNPLCTDWATKTLNLKLVATTVVFPFYKLFQIIWLYVEVGYIYDIFSERNYLYSLYEIQWNEEEMLMVNNNIKYGICVSMYKG